MDEKKASKASIREHDKLCRCMLNMRIGQDVQVVFNAGGYIKGKVIKKRRKFFIGENCLNGKMIKGVHLNNILEVK